MPEEENKAADRRVAEEVFNGHDVEALDDLLALTFSTMRRYPNRSMASMDSRKRSDGYSPPSQTSITTPMT
jgi:hypothetical protein